MSTYGSGMLRAHRATKPMNAATASGSKAQKMILRSPKASAVTAPAKAEQATKPSRGHQE